MVTMTNEPLSSYADETIRNLILDLLADFPVPITQSMIHVHVAPRAISFEKDWRDYLDKLVTDGLVKRGTKIRSSTKRASVVYSLTEKGRKVQRHE